MRYMTHSRTCTITDPRRWIPPCCRQGLGGYCNWTGLLRSGSHYLTLLLLHPHVLVVGLRAIARAFGPWTPPSEQTRRPAREAYCTYYALTYIGSAIGSAYTGRSGRVHWASHVPFSSPVSWNWRVRRTEQPLQYHETSNRILQSFQKPSSLGGLFSLVRKLQ